MRIAVDMTRCQSYAQCCFLAPESFAFEGEEALLYDSSPDDRHRLKILRAAAACPVQAISIDRRDAPRTTAVRTTGHPAAALTEADRVVVVGASLAGLRAAEAIRSEGFGGGLTLIGDEGVEPYDRPPLSKQVLLGITGADGTTLPSVVDLDADWRLGRAASGLDLREQEVRLDDGTRVGYDRLLIATGARSRPWPVSSEAGLEGVLTLRTAADAQRLRARLATGPGRVLIVGGGFTGSEVASTCRRLGIAVTVVDRGPAPLSGALGATLGDVVADVQREHGVDLRSGVTVVSLEGDADGRFRRAHLSDGSTVDADLAVVALGALRNTEWLQGSGLDAGPRGVLADPTGRVRTIDGRVLDDVFVAGDVARVPHPAFGPEPRSFEHWGTALSQAQIAAHNLVSGGRRVADAIPVFWSIQFGHVIKSVGLPSIADEVVVAQGSATSRSFVAVFGRAGRTVGAVAFDQSKWLGHYEREIAAGAPFPPRDPTVDRGGDCEPVPAGIRTR